MDQAIGKVTVRMHVKTQKNLEQIAAGIDRSRNWLINQAIENYLEVYDWQGNRERHEEC
jgi:predicted transcriptional regulator